MWRKPTAIALLAVAALVAVEAISAGAGRSHARHAPRLPTEVLSGRRADLATLSGKPTAIVFWASWCPPCRREAPQLEQLAGSLHGRANLVGVDWNDSAARAREFISKYDWTFRNLRDGDGTTGNAYGLQGLPTTYVLDPDGRIARTLRGPQTAASISAALDATR